MDERTFARHEIASLDSFHQQHEKVSKPFGGYHTERRITVGIKCYGSVRTNRIRNNKCEGRP